MGASSLAGAVTAVVAPVVQASGFELEDVSISAAGRRSVVRLIVDLPGDQLGSISLDEIGEVSRAISVAMDESDPLGTRPYVLEVSSPGADRPLTQRRHWQRARGRLVKVWLAAGDDGKSVGTTLGRLLEVDDEGITLNLSASPAAGKGAAAGPKADDEHENTTTLSWDALTKGVVELEFTSQEQT